MNDSLDKYSVAYLNKKLDLIADDIAALSPAMSREAMPEPERSEINPDDQVIHPERFDGLA